MIVRKLRLQRAWSQEHLADLSGLNVRTVQRIERGHNAGLESLKALAAAFDVDVETLRTEATMNDPASITEEEEEALDYVRDLRGFYAHLIPYVTVISAFLIANLFGYMDFRVTFWTAFGWGIGVAVHAISVFEPFSFLGPEWEKRQVEKRLGRKL